MASIYLGLNVGGDYSPDKVQEGSSTNSTDVEVRIDYPTASGTNAIYPYRSDVDQILEAISRYLLDGRSATIRN